MDTPIIFPSREDFYFLDLINSCFISVGSGKVIKLRPAELEYFRNESTLKQLFPLSYNEIEALK